MDQNSFENFVFLPLKPTGQPPIRWSELEEYADEYRYKRSADSLTNLLDNWARYWNWAWGGEPPPTEYLIYIWKSMVNLIEINEHESGRKVIRFTDPSSAQALANKVANSLFSYLMLSNFIVVINAELCFLNMEGVILATVSEAHPDYRRWSSMILLNRLILAFERFCFKTEISEDWEETVRIPSSFEVMIERVKRLI